MRTGVRSTRSQPSAAAASVFRPSSHGPLTREGTRAKCGRACGARARSRAVQSVRSVQRAARSAQCAVCSAQCAVRSAQCAVQSVHTVRAVRSAQCAVQSVRTAQCSVRSAVSAVSFQRHIARTARFSISDTDSGSRIQMEPLRENDSGVKMRFRICDFGSRLVNEPYPHASRAHVFRRARFSTRIPTLGPEPKWNP